MRTTFASQRKQSQNCRAHGDHHRSNTLNPGIGKGALQRLPLFVHLLTQEVAELQILDNLSGDIEQHLQTVFCLFALVNIRKQDVPADDATFGVPHGESANLEPAVYAIGPTDSVRRVISRWMSGFNRAFPRGQHARKVIAMNSVGAGPTFQFVKRPARIIQALLTDEFDRQNKTGNVIDDLAKTLFAPAQGLFGML
jgi:hypothetical protein